MSNGSWMPSLEDAREDPYDAQDEPGASWAPVDLADTLRGLQDGSVARLAPSVGDIGDGHHLFYRGKVNGVAGDSNGGKSWLALAVCTQAIATATVVYVDLEDDQLGTVERLVDLGADPEAILNRFVYIHPFERYDRLAEAHLMQVIAAHNPALVVIDSTGEALALNGCNPNADEDVAEWFRRLPAQIARRGPAVVVLDHVTKADALDPGLWPTGSQRKRAAISGAQYMLRVSKPFSRDRGGSSVLVCAKDRHGTYRQRQRVAELRVQPTSSGVFVDLVKIDDTEEASDFRPTELMRRVSNLLETCPEPMTQNAIAKAVPSKRMFVLDAITVLIREGFITTSAGPRGSVLHTLAKPFRGDCEPGTSQAPKTAPSDHLTCSPPKGGNREQVGSPVPGIGREQVGIGDPEDQGADDLCPICGYSLTLRAGIQRCAWRHKQAQAKKEAGR